MTQLCVTPNGVIARILPPTVDTVVVMYPDDTVAILPIREIRYFLLDNSIPEEEQLELAREALQG